MQFPRVTGALGAAAEVKVKAERLHGPLVPKALQPLGGAVGEASAFEATGAVSLTDLVGHRSTDVLARPATASAPVALTATEQALAALLHTHVGQSVTAGDYTFTLQRGKEISVTGAKSSSVFANVRLDGSFVAHLARQQVMRGTLSGDGTLSFGFDGGAEKTAARFPPVPANGAPTATEAEARMWSAVGRTFSGPNGQPMFLVKDAQTLVMRYPGPTSLEVRPDGSLLRVESGATVKVGQLRDGRVELSNGTRVAFAPFERAQALTADDLTQLSLARPNPGAALAAAHDAAQRWLRKQVEPLVRAGVLPPSRGLPFDDRLALFHALEDLERSASVAPEHQHVAREAFATFRRVSDELGTGVPSTTATWLENAAHSPRPFAVEPHDTEGLAQLASFLKSHVGARASRTGPSAISVELVAPDRLRVVSPRWLFEPLDVVLPIGPGGEFGYRNALGKVVTGHVTPRGAVQLFNWSRGEKPVHETLGLETQSSSSNVL